MCMSVVAKQFSDNQSQANRRLFCKYVSSDSDRTTSEPTAGLFIHPYIYTKNKNNLPVL